VLLRAKSSDHRAATRPAAKDRAKANTAKKAIAADENFVRRAAVLVEGTISY